MLRSTVEILSYGLEAKDGTLGKVKDLYFDDVDWTVRYFVADTRRWLPGRRVLLLPGVVGQPDWVGRVIAVRLTKEEVKSAPEASEVYPVSSEHAAALARYYLLQSGTAPASGGLVVEHPPRPDGYQPQDVTDGSARGRLHSLFEVTGYRVHATDGEVGQLVDLIAETDDWVIRYGVVDTRRRIPGGEKVLISAMWIDEIDWRVREVKLDLSRNQVHDSPPFDSGAPVNQEIETRLYDYHGRPSYWG